MNEIIKFISEKELSKLSKWLEQAGYLKEANEFLKENKIRIIKNFENDYEEGLFINIKIQGDANDIEDEISSMILEDNELFTYTYSLDYADFDDTEHLWLCVYAYLNK